MENRDIPERRTLIRLEIPTDGPIDVRYNTPAPLAWLKNGCYVVRIEDYATEEVGKARDRIRSQAARWKWRQGIGWMKG
jgi:hypothetical protein